MDEFLTDLEKEKISAFCSDETLKEAVRKVMLAGIYSNGVIKKDGKPHDPTKNFALTQAFQAMIHSAPITDEELGQNIRARAAGIQMVEQGFAELDKIHAPAPAPEPKPAVNKAL